MLYLMYHRSVSSYGLLPLLLYLLLYIGICYHAAIAVVQYLVLYLCWYISLFLGAQDAGHP